MHNLYSSFCVAFFFFLNVLYFCRKSTLPSCSNQRDLNAPDVVITISHLPNKNYPGWLKCTICPHWFEWPDRFSLTNNFLEIPDKTPKWVMITKCDIKFTLVVWCHILRICALHFTHLSAYTQQWIVNKWTHTQSSGLPFFCYVAQRAVGGLVPFSRVSHQSRCWGWMRALYIDSPPPTITAGTETQTRDLLVTSLTL